MDKILIKGGRRLAGEVTVAGAKNAALPILFATLLTDQPCVVRNLPDVADVRTALRLLSDLGATVEQTGTDATVHARALTAWEAPYELVKTMRASFLVLGPLLARAGRARVSQPGGCAIGGRPVNLHLNALQKMGAEVELVHGYTEARAGRLTAAQIHLDFPSVGATEHLMMVACLANGTTEIDNAAREPEIVDLAAALSSMGARIRGAGEATIQIEGVEALGGMTHRVLPDRIEAGTFMIGAAMTGGDVVVHGAQADCLQALVVKLREAGATLEEMDGAIRVTASRRLQGVDIKTLPYPGFPTDLQAQMMALATVSQGSSLVSETIFENRFMHANEFMRLGADIAVDGHNAVVRGVPRLSGAPVMATDLRASVSLILAGLVAHNSTEIRRVYHLDRGYERIEEKLSALGADIVRVKGGRG